MDIRRLYVLPEYRNQEIGRQLFDKIIKEINDLRGITSIQVIVCVPFIEAINFLSGHGFCITFLDPKKLEYRMEKLL